MAAGSPAGYFGALIIGLVSTSQVLTSLISPAGHGHPMTLFVPLGLAFLVMTAVELYCQQDAAARFPRVGRRSASHFLRSVLVRYLISLALMGAATALVWSHYYFQSDAFSFTRQVYLFLWLCVLVLGLPFLIWTLRHRGSFAYDINDVSMICLAALRAVVDGASGWLHGRNGQMKSGLRRLGHARIRKVVLAYLVGAFFLTLMTRFFDSEYHAFAQALEQLDPSAVHAFRSFERIEAIYAVLFHLIFVVDVGLAVVAYAFSSRWLGNRIRSVDTSVTGWGAALICYPPFNQGVADHFIGYGHFATHPLIEAEWARMVLMALILLSFTVYVWATMALGFKFGNLVNRGIVRSGPYRFVRHPAYASKNLAWWLDNTQVLTNAGAALALAAWNVIYWMRGITEERHLVRDAAYRAYQARTPNRFLPSLRPFLRWRLRRSPERHLDADEATYT